MSTNTMSPHVRKTVEEIDGDIVALQADIERLGVMRTGLIELYGGETEIPPIPQLRPKAGKAAKTGHGATSATTPERAAAALAPGAGRSPDATSAKLMAFVRTAPEPFTAVSLAVATGLDNKDCANRLFRWMNNKIVEKVGRGEFKRAAHFPGEAPTE